MTYSLLEGAFASSKRVSSQPLASGALPRAGAALPCRDHAPQPRGGGAARGPRAVPAAGSRSAQRHALRCSLGLTSTLGVCPARSPGAATGCPGAPRAPAPRHARGGRAALGQGSAASPGLWPQHGHRGLRDTGWWLRGDLGSHRSLTVVLGFYNLASAAVPGVSE